MSSPVTTLSTCEKVGRIVDILEQQPFNGFPIVEEKQESTEEVGRLT